jgi:hypothetical protein
MYRSVFGSWDGYGVHPGNRMDPIIHRRLFRIQVVYLVCGLTLELVRGIMGFRWVGNGHGVRAHG